MDLLKDIRTRRGISQRGLAAKARLSFGCVQRMESKGHNWRMKSLQRFVEALGLPARGIDFAIEQYLNVIPDSVADISVRIRSEGFHSWKTHLFNFVDRFRATGDPSLIEQPPISGIDLRLQSLIASTVESLCAEKNARPPNWCRSVLPLQEPWFVSGLENLKAMALIESPASFRKRNIFVLSNFLERV